MAVVETYPERYANPADFAREVNLPLLGSARVRTVPSGAGLAQLLEASAGSEALGPVVESLTETRRSLTLRSLLVAGFPHDPECFATALGIAREWSRRGIRVAVVDLEFWNPTLLRPPGHPNEGLVDVLEYGCSFSRVAWEIVADRLWLIGPGSHPPDETRIAEHPDWPRAARVFASCVDVAIYAAPLLDRRGFTGKLSKRMDAVLLAASTERVGRADLRDAFLELWGSDAPMIGCVGIEPTDARSSTLHSEAARPAPAGASAGEPAHRAPEGLSDSDLLEISGKVGPEAFGRSSAKLTGAPEPPIWEREASAAAYAQQVARAASPEAHVSESWISESRTLEPQAAEPRDGGFERELEAALERDVRRGIVEKKSGAKAGGIFAVVVVVLGVAVLAGALSAVLSNRSEPPRGSIQASQPAGEEPVAATPATPEEKGNLDDPTALGKPSNAGAGEVGSVTALGREIETAQAPPTAGIPPAPAAGIPPAPAAGIPPASSSPPSTPHASPAPVRASLGAAGTGALSVPPPDGNAGAASTAGKPFRVHVASFRTEAKVREIAQSLRAKKLDAWFEPPPPGGGWYRVFVGRFATEAEAATYAQWLLKTGAVDRAEIYPQTKR